MTTLLDPKRTAQMLGGVSVKTLAKWRCAGGGPPFIKMGSRVLYAMADVERYIAELPRHRSTADTVGATGR